MAIHAETPDDGKPHRVSAVGLDPATLGALARAGPMERARALAIYTGDRVPGPHVPAVTGTYVVDAAGLHFLPRFRFIPGLRYTARLVADGAPLEQSFEVAVPAGRKRPRVVTVHPSGETLPENALRLYVQFSRPMTARGVHRQVRLLDPEGRQVPLAFVEVGGGLWDPGQTRLTLFFHPGRVKRGVAPGERLGLPLRAGSEYRLVIDGAMADAAGIPMAHPYERRFRAVEADRSSPRATDVRVEPPTSARGPVVVTMPEPLDQALLHRWVWVEDGQGAPVVGHAVVGNAETLWTFEPQEPWTPGGYAVRLRAALEDRAGNRFDRPFERDGTSPAVSDEEDGILTLPFEVPRLP